MNTESPIPKPETISIPKQDLDALLAELEALRKGVAVTSCGAEFINCRFEEKQK